MRAVASLVRANLYRLAVSPSTWCLALCLAGLVAADVLWFAGAWADCVTLRQVLIRASTLGVSVVFSSMSLMWLFAEDFKELTVRGVLTGRHGREAYVAAGLVTCLIAGAVALVGAAALTMACYFAVGGRPVAVDGAGLATWWALGVLVTAGFSMVPLLLSAAFAREAVTVVATVALVIGMGHSVASALAQMAPAWLQPALLSLIDRGLTPMLWRLSEDVTPAGWELAWALALAVVLALASAALLRRRELR